MGDQSRLLKGKNAIRYRLHNQEGIVTVLEALAGLIQNPIRLAQIKQLCTVYNVLWVDPVPLTSDSAYVIGLIDSDGSVKAQWSQNQVAITVSQKGRELLNLLRAAYGGSVYWSNAAHTASVWTVYRKEDVLSIVNLHNTVFRCLSAKQHRIDMIVRFYNLSAKGGFKADIHSTIGQDFINLKADWANYKPQDTV